MLVQIAAVVATAGTVTHQNPTLLFQHHLPKSQIAAVISTNGSSELRKELSNSGSRVMVLSPLL